LLIERKWYAAIVSGIYALYEAVNHHIADYVAELTERYELTLPELESKTAELENKVKSHLKTMGFAISADKANYTELRRNNLYKDVSVEEADRFAAERSPQKSFGMEDEA